MVTHGVKRAIIEERKLYRGVGCTCPNYADHRLGCPMGRPSRSQNLKRTLWVWSHGGARRHCADPGATPYREQLTEKYYNRATAEELVHSNPVWQNLIPAHYLMQYNREWHSGKPG
eukprot:8154769-Pyramimonas_sp.AAC.1